MVTSELGAGRRPFLDLDDRAQPMVFGKEPEPAQASAPAIGANVASDVEDCAWKASICGGKRSKRRNLVGARGLDLAAEDEGVAVRRLGEALGAKVGPARLRSSVD